MFFSFWLFFLCLFSVYVSVWCGCRHCWWWLPFSNFIFFKLIQCDLAFYFTFYILFFFTMFVWVYNFELYIQYTIHTYIYICIKIVLFNFINMVHVTSIKNHKTLTFSRPIWIGIFKWNCLNYFYKFSMYFKYV